MGVGDDQLHLLGTAPDQPPLKSSTRRFPLLDRAKPLADDLASTIGADGDGDYRRHRHDAAALGDRQVGGVQPQIGPIPSSGWFKKAWTCSSISSQSLATWLLAVPERSMACTRSSTRRVDTPPIPSIRFAAQPWITATSAFSLILRGSRNGRK